MEETKLKIPVSVEIITPVHIGSGDKLREGQDYILNNKKLSVVSVDKVLAHYGKDRTILLKIEEALMNGQSIFSFLPGFDIDDFKIYEINNSSFAGGHIFSFIKDSFLKPYIPGSSIKGAIRTVILQHLLRENPDTISKLFGNDRNGKPAFKNPEDVIFGKDALYDPMKAFVACDFYFSLADLAIFNAKLFDIRQEDSYGWKKMGRNGSISNDISEATPISFEALRQGGKSSGILAIDQFFLENYYKSAKNKDLEKHRIERVKDIFLNFFDEFKKITDEYSKRELQGEIDFLKSHNKDGELSTLIKNHSSLLNYILNDKDSIYLRIAWGIGWKGMTGDYLDDKSLEALRKVKRLGRDYSKIFPKTRRFIVQASNSKELPVYPTGWIRLREKDKND
jgi:hypothetical protein